MMERFLIWALFFVLMFVVGCRSTETDKKNETKQSALNTIAPKITKVIRTEGLPPTSAIRVQRSTLPSRKSTRIHETRIDLISTVSGPIKTHHESTRDSSFFLTSDVRKLNILVVALAAVLIVLTTVVVVLGILHRSMQKKIQRIKEEKDDTTTTKTTDGAITQYRESESRFYNVERTHQPVEYEVPYAHQQAFQIMALANQNSTNNNLSKGQIAPPNGLSITSIMDDGDYVEPRVFEAIAEESTPVDQTLADNKAEYKTPRNATKRAGLLSDETLTNTSTMKDSRGYVIMMNSSGGPVEDDAKKLHVYDVPTTAKTGRSADTFSRKTIKTKIKIFQEKQLKSAKSKHVAPATKEKEIQKDFAQKSVVKNTAYDTPRKV